MKRFARYFLVWFVLSILSGVGGYFFLNNYYIAPVYESISTIYVVTGTNSGTSLVATDGGLKEDFSIIFKSSDVISSAQRTAGTTEDLASYITIRTPANSNVLEVVCRNPDQTTAKKYVDAVVTSALKSTSLIPVEKMSVISSGTSTGVAIRPNLLKYTVIFAVFASAAWFIIELFIGMMFCAFRKKEDDDDEADYYRYYGNELPENENGEKVPVKAKKNKKSKKEAALEAKTEEDTSNDKTGQVDAGKDEEDLDLELELDETDIIEVDILSDIEEEPKTEDEVINMGSSSAVIGRIPR